MYSVDEIRENYLKFEDFQIEKIARDESKTLRRDVLVVLKDEIERRNLDKSLITWVDAETQTFTDHEKVTLQRNLEKLDCSNCENKLQKLSGHRFTSLISAIIWCKQTDHKRILCNSCGRSEKFSAFFKTFLFGWWSKSGLFLTPFILLKSLFNPLFKQKHHTYVLEDFIQKNNGLLRLHGLEGAPLQSIIKNYNESNS
jgi:hypothetical protein